MFRSRIVLAIGLLLSLMPPIAILAQERDVTIPLAVVALEGSWESEDGQACELAWISAGTPTLRVIASDDTRFRQDLVGGELRTIPEVDDRLACVFTVDVQIGDARRYIVSIEGAELVEIASVDLDDRTGTIVLPVEMGADGHYELVTEDYLELEPGEDGELRPAETRPTDPEPQRPDATPIAQDIRGQVLNVEVQVFVFEDLMAPSRDGCRVDALDDDAMVRIDASSGLYHSRLSLRHDGIPVTARTSPMGEAGCLFAFPMRLPAADTYAFTFQDQDLAAIPFEDLHGRESAYLLAIDRAGNRTPEDGMPLARPALPVAAPVTESGDLGDGTYRIVGRVNLWLADRDDAPFGCAAGPTRTGVYPGAQVVAYDAQGAVVGYGTLSFPGRAGTTVCSFDVAVTVQEAEFYVLELGNGHREVRSFADLELWNWHVFIDTASPAPAP
jgi:hypothetical protein